MSTRVHVEDRGAGPMVRYGGEVTPDVIITLAYAPGDGHEALNMLRSAVERVARDVEVSP